MEDQIKSHITTNISLIGFMGSGKTSTGKILADKLNFLFIDLDNIIELSMNMPISEIFEKHGEEYFRNTETNSIKKIYVNKNCVFACGGGAVLRNENIEIIKKNSTVVFLYVSPGIAFERLKNENNRPLLKTPNKLNVIISLIEKRDDLYRNACDFTVDTDVKSPKEAADEILMRLKK
jgi:shikimate kinase